mgnify:CR=1 FL=1
MPMNVELFIAKKLFFTKKKRGNITQPIIHLATGGIAVSLAVMIIAVGVVVGFKKEVRNKLIGFGSHIQISASFNNQTYETQPIEFSDEIVHAIQTTPQVQHMQRFATQTGIIKADDDFHGIVMKGVDADYDWTFFKNNLTQGAIPQFSDSATSNEILVSKKTADNLKLHLNDKCHVYFVIDGKVRVRPFIVKGIYSTGFSDYDRIFALCDIRHIQRLNQWSESQCSGMEININDFNQLDNAEENIFSIVGNQRDANGNFYMMKTIKEINPQIFSWLELLDMNAIIILLLMMLVAGFTMVSGLLILILDRTNMIGILKAVGACNASIQRLFLYIATLIVGKGMLIGNFIGLTLSLIQTKLGIVTLNPDIYYVDTAPIELKISNILFINIVAFLVSVFILRMSTYIISKISPIKSIRFD